MTEALRGIRLRWPWASACFLDERPKHVLNLGYVPDGCQPWLSEDGQQRYAVRPVSPTWVLLEQGMSSVDQRWAKFAQRWAKQTGRAASTLTPQLEKRAGIIGIARLHKIFDVESLSCLSSAGIEAKFAPWLCGPLAAELRSVVYFPAADGLLGTQHHPGPGDSGYWQNPGEIKTALLRPTILTRLKIGRYLNELPREETLQGLRDLLLHIVRKASL